MNRVLPVGDSALLLEVDDNASVHAVARAAREQWGRELADVVPGHTTVLLVWRERLSGERPSGERLPGREALMSDLNALARSASAFRSDMGHPQCAASGSTTSVPLTIPVRYDGRDLGDAAAALGVGTDEIVKLHTGVEFRVAFMGFAPGFPYLIADAGTESADAGSQATAGSEATAGSDAVMRLLELPRLPTPRTEVPAGSVAVAAGYCGVYPRSSPGGWNLLGHTEAELFDPEREPPALLSPGLRVRFEAI